MNVLTPITNKECILLEHFFTVTTAPRKTTTQDIVQLGCGVRSSPGRVSGFLFKVIWSRIPTLLNMFIPLEARFINSFRAQRVEVSDLQTWMPNSLQIEQAIFFRIFHASRLSGRSTLVSCYVRQKNAKKFFTSMKY